MAWGIVNTRINLPSPYRSVDKQLLPSISSEERCFHSQQTLVVFLMSAKFPWCEPPGHVSIL
jgi:hypothetical protein